MTPRAVRPMRVLVRGSQLWLLEGTLPEVAGILAQRAPEDPTSLPTWDEPTKAVEETFNGGLEIRDGDL